MAEEVVETVFTLVDKVSASSKEMAKQLRELEKQAEAAKAALQKTGGAPPKTPGMPAGGAPSTPSAPRVPFSYEAAGQQASGLTKEQRQGMREERRIERERMWSAREAAEKHQIGGQIALASAQMLGLSMQGTAGKITQFGAVAGQIGVQLSQFGGKIGALGGQMAKMGGVLSAGAVGYAFGTFIDDVTGASDAISNWASGFPSSDEIKSANTQFSKAMGFRSASEYSSARKAQDRMAMELKMSTASKKHVSALAGLREGTKEYNTALLEAAKATMAEGGSRWKMDAVLQQLVAQAGNSIDVQSASFMQRTNAEIELTEQAKKLAAGLGTIPANATGEEMRAMNAKISSAGIELVKMLEKAGIFTVTAEQAIGAVKEQQSKSSLQVGRTWIEQEGSAAMLNEKLKNAAKGVRAGDIATIYSRAKEIAGTTGDVGDIATQLKQKIGEKSKKNFDFRGSKFSIEQTFAEGYTPDQIAVAFASDLASLGERATQGYGGAPFGVK